ncbi:XrtB/PEP-CTERM-associated transcriptional regulator EpsA [Marinobacter salicampi]|uniref:XrtB/PEP-CTERM-associated transcriptional regulator EpsA n=1 Tax=Marinobacter salicampi TaxID=435907 RepID=UPI00140A93A4|nr:XrtB/PEP-CTERM-associated transcriptional regulator EpsA [Marinobacter salicampi]
MDDAPEIPVIQKIENDHFIDVLQPALRAQSHLDIFLWMQGEVQSFLPHEIFVAVGCDKHREQFQVDLISAMPQMRTSQMSGSGIVPLVKSLLLHWDDIGRYPFCMTRPTGFSLEPDADNLAFIDTGFGSMRSALATGIQDQREHYQSLYIAFSQSAAPPPSAAKYMRMLTPYIDFALRQVAPIPSCYASELKPEKPDKPDCTAFGLTQREAEIMQWVAAGKTNEIIGVILNISPFTVKNHLKRIFQKLEVTNRAQAVSKL